MENITLGQVVGAISTITAIAVFFIAIFKWYKANLSDRFSKLEKDVLILKQKVELQEKEIEESKQERLILLKRTISLSERIKRKRM